MPEPTSVNTNQNHMVPFSSAPPPSGIVIDGSEEDAILGRSQFLTRYEVLKRRARRTKQLAIIYKDHYWSLMEDLRNRYRDYYWEHGKSPFLEDEKGDVCNNNLEKKSGLCAAPICKNKAMPLTVHCHMHILSNNEQKLYKRCNFIVKSSPTCPLTCGQPTLRSTVPLYCPTHFHQAEKYVAKALKKAGLNVSSASKTGPKFNVLVSEYVRLIQTKRSTTSSSVKCVL